jgi:hypothetical protein
LKLPSRPNWRMSTLEGARSAVFCSADELEGVVYQAAAGEFSPFGCSVMLVWAHSWGKKVQVGMSFRASGGAARRVVVSSLSVGGMIDWVMYERSLF